MKTHKLSFDPVFQINISILLYPKYQQNINKLSSPGVDRDHN